MVADELDYVIGVDTHLDEHVLAIIAAPSGAVVARRSIQASARGYAAALRFAAAEANSARVWAIEGTGSYGAGLARFLAGRKETVLEISRTPRAERRLRGKTTPSTPPGQHGRRLRARRSRFHAAGNGAKRCGCCWSRVAAPSMSAGKHSGNYAA